METAKTLLIVEDDTLTAMTLQDALEEAGYEVMDLTGRHQDAIVAAEAGKPDLALVNIELQGRDDGIALARELTAMGIPVLFISGQSSRAKSAQTAAVGSLPKPYTPTEMVEAVDYLLNHLKGDDTHVRPHRLEVFDRTPDGLAPKAA
ncbi:MAG: two-component system, response regulator PdtaR [Mycobacterium sp.]|jgi:DNA-binding response OmpR family regulator|nr:two-component system, response regulator PdtaR [Mycobacterium sp.]